MMGNTAATELGDERTPEDKNPWDPDPLTWSCRCSVCRPEWYARRKALTLLEVEVDAWSDLLVESENSYTDDGNDPLFDVLHVKLNDMRDEIVDAWNFEDERIRILRGD